jgi:putative sterol carrier protein
MATFADRDAATGVTETYQYVVGRTVFHFIVDDGSIQLRGGNAERPAVVLTTDEETWADMATGKTSGASAAAAGAVKLVGERDAIARLAMIFSRSTVLGQAEEILKSTKRRP